MLKDRLFSIPAITDKLKTCILTLEAGMEAPLSFDQDLLVEDICQALGVDVEHVLDYTPSAAQFLDAAFDHVGMTSEGLQHFELHFLRLDPNRPRLQEETPCPS
jgi:hypothetical protein